MRCALVGAMIAVLISPFAVGTQEAPSAVQAPWSSFAGCWAPSAESDSPPATRSGITCLVPVDGDPLAADFIGFVGGAEVRRSRIVADGTLRDFNTESCRGRESARFSADGRLVLLQGELACGTSEPRRTTGVLSLTESDRLLSVSGGDRSAEGDVSFGYRARVERNDVPESVRSRVLNAKVVESAAVGSPVSSALSSGAIIEVSSVLSAAGTEIWIAGMAADAQALFEITPDVTQSLEQAGVPARVRELVEALGDPTLWHVSLSASGAAVQQRSIDQVAFLRRINGALVGLVSLSGADGARGDAAFMANASSVPVGNACLGARLLTDGSFGTFGSAPAFAHVLFARACPSNGLYDPNAMNTTLYGAYGGGRPGAASQGVPRPDRSSGLAGDATPAAGEAARRVQGTSQEGGASQGRASSHPAPDAIPLGGLGTPRAPASAPSASPAPSSAPHKGAPSGRVP